MATKASEKQVGYIRSLIEKLTELDPEMAQLNNLPVETYSKRDASNTIDTLRTALQANRAAARKEAMPKLEPGFYQVDGRVYEVKRSESSGNLYAKAIDPETGRFEYERGAIFKLDGASPMTLREAAEFGKVHGRCVVCGRTLSNVASIEAGIGPVCARRFA